MGERPCKLRVTINPCNIYGPDSQGCSQPTADAIQESIYSDNQTIVNVTIPARIK